MNGVGESLGVDRADIFVLKQFTNQPARCWINHYRIRRSRALQACRQVERCPYCRLFVSRLFTDNHKTRGDADASGQNNAGLRGQNIDRLDRGQPRPHSPFGLMFMRPRPPKIGQNAVSKVFRYMPVKTRHFCGNSVLIRAQDVAKLFWIKIER